jgi:hypothetical protein
MTRLPGSPFFIRAGQGGWPIRRHHQVIPDAARFDLDQATAGVCGHRRHRRVSQERGLGSRQINPGSQAGRVRAARNLSVFELYQLSRIKMI